MSNAGKVLLGADGNPLLGVGGIVKADRLWPMNLSASQSIEQFYRVKQVATSSGDVSANDETWGNSTAEDGALRNVVTSPASQTTRHVVSKITLSDFKYANYTALEVIWGKFEKATLKVTGELYAALGDDGEYIPLRLNYAVGDQSDPSGSEEVWDRSGWAELVTSGDLDVGTGTTETFDIEFTPADVVDGELVIWLSQHFDVYTPPSPAVYVDRQAKFESVNLSEIRIKYNLAT